MFHKTIEAICNEIYNYKKIENSNSNTNSKTKTKTDSGLKNKLSQPFEIIVEKIIVKNGCISINDKEIIKSIKKINNTKIDFNEFEKLKKNKIYYIRNPNGSQCPPDFLIISNNYKQLKLECKSSKTLKPVWNCSLPSNDTIYAFYSSKINNCFLFRSFHIITDDTIKSLNNLVEQINILCKEYKKSQTKNKELKSSFEYYNRKMFNQLVNFNITERTKLYEDVIKEILTLI